MWMGPEAGFKVSTFQRFKVPEEESPVGVARGLCNSELSSVGSSLDEFLSPLRGLPIFKIFSPTACAVGCLFRHFVTGCSTLRSSALESRAARNQADLFCGTSRTLPARS